MSQSKRSPIHVQAKARAAKAIELRIEGKTLAEIAAKLGLKSRSSVRDALDRELATMVDRHQVEELRGLEAARLDAIQVRLWPKRGDPKYAAVLVKLIERRCKLFGLDAPVKIDFAASVDVASTVLNISDDELIELQQQLRSARGLQSTVDVETAPVLEAAD